MEASTMVFGQYRRAINSEIEVTALAFRQPAGQRGMQGYPKRMVWGGREYHFAGQGMQYMVRKGMRLIKLFDVSDEQGYVYRLRLENNRWTLVAMQAGAV